MVLRKRKFFTLLELIIVIMIVSILAGMALTGVYKSREHALLRQAIVELRMIKDAEQAYLLKRSTFTSCTNAANCGNYLNLMFSDTANLGSGGAAWAYNVNGAYPYCAYATRICTALPCSSYVGCTYRYCLDGSTVDPVYNAGSCP